MGQKTLQRLLTALFVSSVCTLPLTATDSVNIGTSVDAVCCATPPARPAKKEAKKKKVKKEGKKKSSEKDNTSRNSAELQSR